MGKIPQLLQCWIKWTGLFFLFSTSMATRTHGTGVVQGCGVKQEAGGIDAMVLIQTETGTTNGEVCLSYYSLC